MAPTPSRQDSCVPSSAGSSSRRNSISDPQGSCKVIVNRGVPETVTDLRATCTLRTKPDPDADNLYTNEADRITDSGFNHETDSDASQDSPEDSASVTDLKTVTCKDSTHPFHLPARRLTKHSRLFATLACCPSTTTNLPLNIDHSSFTVFTRFLRSEPISLPPGTSDRNGYGTDIYTLLHAHAAGETLQAPVFTDMVMDAIISELTTSDLDSEGGDIARRDARDKTRDLDLLLPAACLLFPPGSVGRDFFVDWYVHEPARRFHNLSVASAVETGDLDFLARCMVKLRDLREEVVIPPYVRDACRYHVHRSMGLPCYRRGRRGRYSGLEYAVRVGLGGEGDEDDDDDGLVGLEVMEYEDCVDEASLMVMDEGERDYEGLEEKGLWSRLMG